MATGRILLDMASSFDLSEFTASVALSFNVGHIETPYTLHDSFLK